jgi:hypothetical protein
MSKRHKKSFYKKYKKSLIGLAGLGGLAGLYGAYRYIMNTPIIDKPVEIRLEDVNKAYNLLKGPYDDRYGWFGHGWSGQSFGKRSKRFKRSKRSKRSRRSKRSKGSRRSRKFGLTPSLLQNT